MYPMSSSVSYTSAINYQPHDSSLQLHPEPVPLPDENCVFCQLAAQQDCYQQPSPNVFSEFFSFQINDQVSVDFSPNHSLLVRGPETLVLVNNEGTSAGFIDDGFSVFQDGRDVDINVGHRRVKMSPRGISFTSLKRSLVYIVDQSGCKTTYERFNTVDAGFIWNLFMTDGATIGQQPQVSVAQLIKEQCRVDGSDLLYELGPVRFRIQPETGDVTVSKDRVVVVLLPGRGQAKLFTPLLSVSVDRQRKLAKVVRQHQWQMQSMTLAKSRLNVQVGAQKAALDPHDMISLS